MDNQITLKYLIVSLERVQEGFSVHAWISMDRPHGLDLLQHQFIYTYIGEGCTWHIFANTELTSKVVSMCGVEADRICIEGKRITQKRLAVNR